MLALWQEEGTFAASLKQREGGKRFSFYDGPPFANGLPHPGHVVPVTLKDAITRYKTMQGYYVPRRNGWDTHGLPVENEVEKQLGLKDKQEILKLGIDKFNQACRDSVFKYRKEWENFFDRMGRWADKDNAYATLDDSYIESVWWVLSQLDQKQLVYQGFRSMPYCPRCATPLSNFEVNQNYKDDVPDPSLYILFALADQPDVALLAWTTTPWTLPANAALAVAAAATYVTIEADGRQLILAAERLPALELSDYKVIKEQKGKELVGLRYQPLYQFVTLKGSEKEKAFRVYADEAVDLSEGSGILHMAPRYGEADLAIGQREGLPLISSVDEFGYMTKEMGPFAGMFFKDADGPIIADLTKQQRVFAAETAPHTYPFCWRCETPLMYYATPSWFVKVSQLGSELVKTNQQIDWVPAHLRDGRFGNWLAEARDWGISRNRFWGAPLPIWQCANGHTMIIGSIAELKEKAVDPIKIGDLHRPAIDGVKLTCSQCMQEASRVPEVFDCWFESGSMPYAQDHYPFEQQAQFEQAFPADFIAEAIDQTRGWFYTLHVLATALFGRPAFQNVIVNGHILAADGKKLSKRLRNYPQLEEVFASYGADTLRFFMMSSPVVAGESVRFSAPGLGEVQRNVFLTLWNVFSFWQTYGQTAGWQPFDSAQGELAEPASEHILDRWMLSRLNQAIAEVTRWSDQYQVAPAVRELRQLIDELSNWYLRRSRRRFWKNENAADQAAAFATLHYALVRLCQLLAPWAPFMSDKLWRELTAGLELPASVHLSDWPAAGAVESGLLEQMQQARQIISEGLAQRAAAGIKVRQPLSGLEFGSSSQLPPDLLAVMAEELNVKEVTQRQEPEVQIQLNVQLTPELESEGLARDVIRQVQSQRRQQGLQMDQAASLSLETSDPALAAAIEQQRELIERETISQLVSQPPGEAVEVTIGPSQLRLALAKKE